MMGKERRWRGVGREELDVEAIGVINGDHGFAVVVEIFQEGFAHGVNFSRIGWRRVTREEIGLLFERAQEGG